MDICAYKSGLNRASVFIVLERDGWMIADQRQDGWYLKAHTWGYYFSVPHSERATRQPNPQRDSLVFHTAADAEKHLREYEMRHRVEKTLVDELLAGTRRDEFQWATLEDMEYFLRQHADVAIFLLELLRKVKALKSDRPGGEQMALSLDNDVERWRFSIGLTPGCAELGGFLEYSDLLHQKWDFNEEAYWATPTNQVACPG